MTLKKVTKLTNVHILHADAEYLDCIRDLKDHESVRSMKDLIQHRKFNCLEHSIYVSLCAYRICKRLGLDYRSAARGGLLHDFFLYNWRHENSHTGFHAFVHPRYALKNADAIFALNRKEKDIILKHMWPITATPPRYKEAFIVNLADKYCAVMELFSFRMRKNAYRLQSILCT